MRFQVYLIIFLFLLLLSAGCTLKQNVSYGCCQLDQSGRNCVRLIGDVSEGISSIPQNTIWCNPTTGNQTCNVTLSINPPIRTADGRVQSEVQPVLSICSDRVSTCLNGDCKAQVCGPFTYKPTPIPSLSDAINFEEEAESTGEVDALDIAGEGVPLNLYRTTCYVLPMDAKLQNYFKNAKGSSINVFRFGIGDSFADFDFYRYMFPFRDVYCNVNPFIKDGKERFMNYLFSPDDFVYKRSVAFRRDIEFPLDEMKRLEYTPIDESPFVGADYFGNVLPGYKMMSVMRNAVSATGQAQTLTSYLELDKKFYKNFLTIMYKQELDASYNTGVVGVPTPAPFECQTPTDCNSGFCNFNDYSRGLCKIAGSNEWTRCSCNGPARSCQGYNTTETYLNNGPAPTTEATLVDHVNAYLNNNQEYLVQAKQNPVFNILEVDPSCDTLSTTEEGVETARLYAENCEARPDGTYRCNNDPPPAYGIRCTNNNGQLVCTANTGGSSSYVIYRNCQYNAPQLICDAESRILIRSCTSQGFTPSGTAECDTASGRCPQSERISCENGVVSCSLVQPYRGRDPANPQSPALVSRSDIDSNDASFREATALCNAPYNSCRYTNSLQNVGDPPRTLDCGRQTSQITYGDCVTQANGEIVCNRKADLAQEGTLSPRLDNARFPTDVQFFGEARTRNGQTVIGYSLLTENRFRQTDFYAGCQLSPTDYDIITVGGTPGPNNVELGEGVDEMRAALRTGILYPSPDPIALEFLGGQVAQAPDCDFISDDYGYYRYVPQYILLKANGNRIGRCELTPQFTPVTKTFGWCEACSYATLAKEVVTTGSDYQPTTQVTSRRVDTPSSIETKNVCVRSQNGRETPGSPVRTPALFCPTADDPAYENTRPDPNLYPTTDYFDVTPEAVYLQEKQKQYLQEGVMPVIDLTDASNWGSAPITLSGTLRNQARSGGNTLWIDLTLDGVLTTGAIGFDVVSTVWQQFPVTPTANDRVVVRAVRETGTFAINAQIDIRENGGTVTTIPVRILEGTTEQVQPTGGPTVGSNWQDAVINRGPSILIVDTLSLADAQNVATVDRLQNRLSEARRICSSCTLSFKISNGAPQSRRGSERINDDLSTLAALNTARPAIFIAVEPVTTQGSARASAVDVISFDLYPNEFSAERQNLCRTPTALNEYILSEVERRSRGLLTQYNNKLSLITDFALDPLADAPCWVANNGSNRFFSYFFAKQKRLARVGLIGAIYTDTGDFAAGAGSTSTPGGIAPDFLTAEYYSLERGSRNLATDEPITIFSQVYASPADESFCTECSEADIALGTCTTIRFPARDTDLPVCSNGARCRLPDPLPQQSLVQPNVRGTPTQWKCPELVIPQPCTLCSTKQGSLGCTFYYPDGTIERNTYPFSSLSDVTPDIIASIPQGETCCLRDTSQNSYTYVKQVSAGRTSAPIQFSSTGDPRADCGLGDFADLDPQACGVNQAPLRNYRVECSIVQPATAPRTTGGTTPAPATTPARPTTGPPPNCIPCSFQEIQSGLCTTRACSDGRECTVLPQDRGFINNLRCP